MKITLLSISFFSVGIFTGTGIFMLKTKEGILGTDVIGIIGIEDGFSTLFVICELPLTLIRFSWLFEEKVDKSLRKHKNELLF